MSEIGSIVAAMHEAFNARSFDRYAEFLDEEVRLMIADEEPLRGRAAVADYAAALARQAPATRLELDEILVETEDTIISRMRAVTVGADEAGSGAPAEDRLTIRFCHMSRVARGRIIELRAYPDRGHPETLLGTARLVTEQSALRRVATLVAGGAAPEQVFESIVTEAVKLLDCEVWLYRYETDGAATVIAHDSRPTDGALLAPAQVPLGGAVSLAFDLQRPVRRESFAGAGSARDLARRLGITASAAAPMLVQGEPWGGLLAVARGAPLEAGIEDRLALFAELAATAVANSQSRAELQLLADEQAALRRVAELVVRGAETQAVFDRVTAEASRLLDDTPTALERYQRAGAEVVIAAQCRPAELGRADERYALGARVPVTGEIGRARVWRTGRASRIDDYRGVAGAEALPSGIKASVSVPILIEGRLWGTLIASSAVLPLPVGTEDRLTGFAELVAAAIANTESRAELTASRARVVAGADEARRRLARDVHDGAQQRLVHALITVKRAQATLDESDSDSRAAQLIAESRRQTEGAYDELRRLAHGILPAALEQGGLRTAIEVLLSDFELPVDYQVLDDRLADATETTAYFVVAEALTNVVKHAAASQARVRVMADGEWLMLEVADDGRGGADHARGSGLVGLSDRVAATGGTIVVTSPPGAGTTVSVRLPLPAAHSSPAERDARA